jgi:hypothetical protein
MLRIIGYVEQLPISHILCITKNLPVQNSAVTIKESINVMDITVLKRSDSFCENMHENNTIVALLQCNLKYDS